ncbi:Gar1-domain-containing protein [Pleurotus eryngii]|uniref:H/ACA ribonucleoprotein complex subunit n=1 Tax=Pleurotus eryngii TaxID=5323 RepID=A0A9P5ZX80_PLEER|nr:Gar1-domain-containing protein [Pleurotus eryngii]
MYVLALRNLATLLNCLIWFFSGLPHFSYFCDSATILTVVTMSRGARGFNRGGGRGGGRGGFQQRDFGPPDTVLEMGTFVHAVEDEMLCSSLLPDKVPYFNAPIYLQNKSAIGKVDEILGPVNEVYFSIKMGEGMVASSFKKGDKVYIGGDKLLPIERFLPKPKVAGGALHFIRLFCNMCSLSSFRCHKTRSRRWSRWTWGG